MNKLIILEHSDGSVHIYDVAVSTKVNEEYIENLGFNLSEISWMYGNLSIHFHKRVLL